MSSSVIAVGAGHPVCRRIRPSVQRQPLLGSAALEPEPDGVVDEALQAELDPDLRGEVADIEVPAGQHPRVVKPGVAGEPEEQHSSSFLAWLVNARGRYRMLDNVPPVNLR